LVPINQKQKDWCSSLDKVKFGRYGTGRCQCWFVKINRISLSGVFISRKVFLWECVLTSIWMSEYIGSSLFRARTY